MRKIKSIILRDSSESSHDFNLKLVYYLYYQDGLIKTPLKGNTDILWCVLLYVLLDARVSLNNKTNKYITDISTQPIRRVLIVEDHKC